MQSEVFNLAYRYLAFALMIYQANLFCEKLDVPRKRELEIADILPGSHNGPLSNGFSGSVLTDDYFFGFDAGHIANFYKRAYKAHTDAEVKRQNVELAKSPCLIDTNGAIALATNWLVLSGIRLSDLQTHYAMSVTQRKYFPKYQPTTSTAPISKDEVALPIFQVQWSGNYVRRGRIKLSGPVVQITVSGINKEMLEYHVYSEQLFDTQPIVIADFEKIAVIKDEEFKAYDDRQLSNFVAQFGGIHMK
jgi:hypothetical protein